MYLQVQLSPVELCTLPKGEAFLIKGYERGMIVRCNVPKGDTIAIPPRFVTDNLEWAGDEAVANGRKAQVLYLVH